MVTGLLPMGCGSCAGGTFKIFQKKLAWGFELHCECQACKSTSIIRPRPPELEIEFGEGDGCLAIAPNPN